MPGRQFSGIGNYRYGFIGMEKDDEVKGEGNSYTTEFRQYDPRLGRWLSIDPEIKKYAWQSPYVAFNNNPIYYDDPLGDDVTEDEEADQFELKPPHWLIRLLFGHKDVTGATLRRCKLSNTKPEGTGVKFLLGSHNEIPPINFIINAFFNKRIDDNST